MKHGDDQLVSLYVRLRDERLIRTRWPDVLSYGWDDPAVRDLVATSKFASIEGFMAAESGHIAFQHHGEEAAFREIRIRRLGP